MTVGRGVWFRKRTTESCCRLDMTYLAKHYNLDLDYQTTMSWKSSYGKRTSIGLDICPPGRIRLYYTVTKGNDKPREYRYNVHVESTDCNYGGQRWWFICPDCSRRCRVLYLPSDEIYFSCRICHNLTYESQQEGKSGWWALFTALTKMPEWEKQLMRSRSLEKRARLEKKMGAVYRGMQSILNWDRKLKRKSRKK